MSEKNDPSLPVLTTKQAANYLQVTEAFLIRGRTNKTGPDYLRLAHNVVRYSYADLDAWLTQKKVRQGA